jgi:hypothetical protein
MYSSYTSLGAPAQAAKEPRRKRSFESGEAAGASVVSPPAAARLRQLF